MSDQSLHRFQRTRFAFALNERDDSQNGINVHALGKQAGQFSRELEYAVGLCSLEALRSSEQRRNRIVVAQQRLAVLRSESVVKFS